MSAAMRVLVAVCMGIVCCVRGVRACCSEEGANRAGCALSCAGRLVGYEVAIDSLGPPSDGWSCVAGDAPAPTIVWLKAWL